MKTRFEEQLDQLKKEMIAMCGLIERAVQNAVLALIQEDIEKAKQILLYDGEIDKKARQIESLCMKLLLIQHSVAGDLRTISSTLKMITDMERIGNHASDIAELILVLAEKPYANHLGNIEKMAKETVVMLIQSLDAYHEKNMEKAGKVIRKDDYIDELFCSVKQELINFIYESADNGEQASNLLMVAKYFEKIGDHTTNIAEWVIFSITGEHIKYSF